MPGNSVIRDKTNERHGLFWRIESCDVTHYSAPTARRQHSESRYGTEQGSPRITLGSLCQEFVAPLIGDRRPAEQADGIPHASSRGWASASGHRPDSGWQTRH